jgi:hypothetical protein
VLVFTTAPSYNAMSTILITQTMNGLVQDRFDKLSKTGRYTPVNEILKSVKHRLIVKYRIFRGFIARRLQRSQSMR